MVGSVTKPSTCFIAPVRPGRRRIASWLPMRATETFSADPFHCPRTEPTLAVGAPWEDSAAVGINGDQSNDASVDSGAVYVFRLGSTAWGQEGRRQGFEHRSDAVHADQRVR